MMNDQLPTNEPFDRHAARRRRREARRAALGTTRPRQHLG